MEEIFRTRLRLLVENIESAIHRGQDALQKLKDNLIELDEAHLTSSKLKSAIERFMSEMYNYYKLVQEASADELSEYTAIQIKGEELMTELNYFIQKKTKTSVGIRVEHPNVTSKLPKMELAKFDGDVLKWHQFWDQFSSNVDSRNINDVDKLLYLQSVLEDEAKRAIEGLETTNKNYQIAISTLKERYGKPGIIIDAHYAALFRIKTADKTVTDSRRVFNEIERHLRVLHSLGEDVNHNHLRVIIMQKFSEDLVYELQMKMGTDSDTIENIRKYLEQLISAREASNRTREQSSLIENVKCTTEALHVGSESQKQNATYKRYDKMIDSRKRSFRNDVYEVKQPDDKRRKFACIFCGNGHFNDECNVAKSVQERKRKLEGRCFNCLAKGHQQKDCRSHMKCRHCGKYGDHNRALCPSKDTVKTENLHVGNICSNEGLTVLQTAVVTIRGISSKSKSETCRVLLDSGSQRSYMTKSLASKLNLAEVEINRLSVFTFGNDSPNEIESPLVKFEISTKTKHYKTLYANLVPHISKGVPTIPNHILKYTVNHIHQDIVLADNASQRGKIDLLIGNDYYFSVITGEKIQIAEDLYLVNTMFGWVWSGKCDKTLENDPDKLSVLTYFQSDITCSSFCEPDLPLKSDCIKKLWDLESIGITDSPKISREEEAVQQFNETTQYFDNRYHVKWPWVEYPPILSSNYGLAFGRLKSLLKRLSNETIKSYDDILKDQLEKGIIEVLPKSKLPAEHIVHYLPHHCVTKNDKLRLVYDASAKSNDSKSLNECLYRGPLMLEELTGLLIRFREHRLGIVADVEKAFLQIGLQNEDRDVTRFLWPKDLSKEITTVNLFHLRFCRVPFGVISSPFLLNATIRYHLMKGNNANHSKVARDIYVDNLVTGVNSVDEAEQLYHSSRNAFNELSMNLREWNSNSSQFNKSIPSEYRAMETDQMKILGLNWDLHQDRLSLRFEFLGKDTNKINTKREILRLIASIFDPCGFAVPLVLPAKLFLQNLWHQEIQWDTKLSEETLTKWNTIMDGLGHIKDISVPRCFTQNDAEPSSDNSSYELHAFTDASMLAYSAVVYIRIASNKQNKVNFVIGKSRLVGKKEQTDLQIPKIELLGVLIGSRLIRYVLKFLKIQVKGLYLWTDSQIAISWCNSEKLLPPFVAKRVNDIKKDLDMSIRYVPSHINPADVATRPNSWVDAERWLKCPDFLLDNSSKWPKLDPEATTSLVLCEQGPSEILSQDDENQHNHLMEVEESQTSDTQEKKENSTEIHCNKNLNDIITAQKECFPKEYEGSQTDLVRSLDVFKDQMGLLRCGGRMNNADWTDDQKHPILLPKNHAFSAKIIEEIHKKNYHVGVSHTLSLIRRKYWIPQGRMQVKKVLQQCISCRKYGGGPYKLPPMAPLPPERASYSDPFTYVGVDYFGPLFVTINGSQEKRWVSLYTCLAVRAIHMEVVTDLTSEECLLALRRFISAKGVPKMITSDNALQFKLTAEVLTSDYCITNEIKWKFIPELAPWFGGFYERLIGIVKNCLKKTLEKHKLNHTQLCTVIKEVEAVVNSRPLTAVSTEVEHILTPADFLRIGGIILTDTSDKEFLETATVTKTNLIDGWKRGQQILKEYISIFTNQYLTSLRDRQNIHRQPRVIVGTIPSIGDVVQVKGDCNRSLWKVGKISSLIKGSDGHIRVAKISTSPNETLTRSIAHLYPLELQEPNSSKSQTPQISQKPTQPQSDEMANDAQATVHSVDHDQTNVSTDDAQATLDEDNHVRSSPQTEDTQRRPVRLSAQRAKDKIKQWTIDLLVLTQLDCS